MSRRYSRILQASRYYSAIDNYIKYITDSTKRGSRVGQGKARPVLQDLAISPFGLKLGTDVLVKQSATKVAWDQYKSAFVGRTEEVTAENSSKIGPKISGYRAPRVNIVTGGTDQGVPETSKVTGLKYLKYNTTSRSIPFGRKSATDTVQVAFENIKAGLGAGIKRAYLINEKL